MNAYPVDLVAELQPCVHASGLLPDDTAPQGLLNPAVAHPALCAALAEALAPRTKVALWTSVGAGQRVLATLVHHDHTLPPARMRAGQRLQDDGARRTLGALPPRSPLSPLFPGGPLFPDGLISPSWVRKHGEYIPVVRLAFFCLAPDNDDALASDAALIEAIHTLQARLAPRGTRVIAVLLCEPLLYAQGVDARVAHVRRATGLDSRGAVYVLSTSASADHTEFFRHMHARVLALARDAYRERARSVRRHRGRCPPPPSVVQPVLQAALATQLLAPTQRALDAPGWSVRLAYKLGSFAEWQSEYNEARAQYMDAYRELMDTHLGSTQGRRRAEAQMLADTLVLKLVRLDLYQAMPGRAHAQLLEHMARIHAQCTAWALEKTALPWAWRAKVYALIAELVHEARVPLGSLDAAILHYHAALCHLETAQQDANAEAARAAAVTCLSAAYDAFRLSQRPRLAHWAAVRLALAYAPTKPAQALPFFERTLRWYGRDAWPVLCTRLVLSALDVATQCHDTAAISRLSWQLRAPVPAPLVKEAQAARDALSKTDATPIQNGTAPLVSVQAVFARASTHLDEPMAFQVVLGVPRGACVDDLSITALSLHATGHDAPLVHLAAGTSGARVVDVGLVRPGSTVQASADPALHHLVTPSLVHGRLAGIAPGPLTFSHVMLHTDRGSIVSPIRASRPVWLVPGTGQRLPLPPRTDPRTLLVLPPPIDVHVPTSLLCGEVVPLTCHSHAPCGTLVLALAPEAVQAGAVLCTETNTHTQLELPLTDVPSVWLRAPPTPSVVRLATHSTYNGAPVPRTQREYSVRVTPAWRVRSYAQEAPNMQGWRHDVECLAPTPIELERVHLAGLPSEHVVPLGAQVGRVWTSPETGTWITQATAAEGAQDAEAVLVLAWHRPGTSAPWPSEARFVLPPLPAPRAPGVRLRVRAPATATVGAAVRLTVSVHNASDHVADARLQVERVDACWLNGATQQVVPLLLPHETRTFTWHLYPQRAGLQVLRRPR
ncbi:hypothetical protein MNAN1_002006 [Malassezia nana]|uniref:Trafficking protein particle complex subunit 11 n=1 Tax=Malassezia nana TaxID=180528 RepID=A0AAF0EIA9_9BASI|nr:hypothetical protein MNAN1_002006 [Malassezia nana]